MSIERSGDFVTTRGLHAFGNNELRLKVLTADQAEAEHLLSHIANYIRDEKQTVRANQTFVYGYWLLQVKDHAGVSTLGIWERSPDGHGFVEGAELATRYWREQNLTCARYGQTFDPPLADRIAATWRGVLDGDDIEGMRYRMPEHHSGWILVSPTFPGDVDQLQNEHLYHVTSQRPEVARFLALPAGCRFYIGREEEDFLFDPGIASADFPSS
jgi:hypothetical protein